MSIRSAEELMSAVEKLNLEQTDENIRFIEDLADTLHENAGAEWKAKFEENDANWRKRYTDRFFNKVIPEPVVVEPYTGIEEPTTFEELFKEE